MLSPMHSGKWTELNCLVQFPAVHWTGDDLYYSRWNWQSSQVLHNRTKFSWIGRKEINHRTKMSDKRWPYCRRFSSVTKPSPVITTSRRLRKAIDHRTKMSDEQRWPCSRRFSSVTKPSPVIKTSRRLRKAINHRKENERRTAMTLSPPVLVCHEAVASHHSSSPVTKSN